MGESGLRVEGFRGLLFRLRDLGELGLRVKEFGRFRGLLFRVEGFG